MKRKWIWVAPALLLGFGALLFIGGEVVKLLWNWIVSPVSGWRELTFWQALGLLALTRILFGGFSRGGGCGWGRSRRGYGRRGWQCMTPDERDRFRQGAREGEPMI